MQFLHQIFLADQPQIQFSDFLNWYKKTTISGCFACDYANTAGLGQRFSKHHQRKANSCTKPLQLSTASLQGHLITYMYPKRKPATNDYILLRTLLILNTKIDNIIAIAPFLRDDRGLQII